MKPHYKSGNHTRGVSIGCAVVEDAKSSFCRFLIRLRLQIQIDMNTSQFLFKSATKRQSKLENYVKETHCSLTKNMNKLYIQLWIENCLDMDSKFDSNANDQG